LRVDLIAVTQMMIAVIEKPPMIEMIGMRLSLAVPAVRRRENW